MESSINQGYRSGIMHSKSVSIAMATYNGERFLKEQLDSILEQTLKPVEIIIVDDASIDNTVNIIQEYQKRYPKIKLIQNQVNCGPTKTFEQAVNLCSGDLIALSDQDDIWELNKLELLAINIRDAKLIHHDATLIDDNGAQIGESLLAFIRYYPIKSFFNRLMREGVHGCCLMMQREVARNASHIPAGFIYHDFFYNLVAASMGEVKTLVQPLMRYRIHQNNACGLYDEKSFTRAIKDYTKNLNNMELIANLAQFIQYKTEIEFYIKYYSKFVKLEKSSLVFIWQVFQLLGAKKAVALIINNLFGLKGLKFFYERFS